MPAARGTAPLRPTVNTPPLPSEGPSASTPSAHGGRDLRPARGRPETAREPDPRVRRSWTLVALIDDDSPVVAAAVRGELLALGPVAGRALRHAARDERPRVRARARAILSELAWDREWRRLARTTARHAPLDLEAALLRLARLEEPRLDARGYRLALDAMGKAVRERAAKAPDAVTAPMALADYLGNELGFIGPEVGYDHPDNIHLHRAIERKRGMPLTLTAVYLFVARRAGIDAAAVPLPGHVLLRLKTGRRSLLIDPFHGGRLRTRADCMQHLARHGLVPQPEWFRDATDAELFQRHVRNLMSSCQARGQSRRARKLAVLAGALARTAACE